MDEQITSNLEATFSLLNPANQFTVTVSAFAFAPLSPTMHREWLLACFDCLLRGGMIVGLL